MPYYTVRFIDSEDNAIIHKIKGTREYLVGFCSVFGTTLYEGDNFEDCLVDYHGLDITVNDDVPISVEDLCEDRYLVTVRSHTEEEKEKYLSEAKGDFTKWFKEQLFEDMEIEYDYTCILFGYNHHIHLTQFQNRDFVKGVIKACALLGIEPSKKISEIHFKDTLMELHQFS